MTTTMNPTDDVIAMPGLTIDQTITVAFHGLTGKFRKLATAKRAAAADKLDPIPTAPAPEVSPAETAADLEALAGLPEAVEVVMDLPETPESYLARLMGETPGQASDQPAIVSKRRAGLAALDGSATGKPGVNGHDMVRKEMKAAWPFARSVYAGGWAPGEVIIQHMSSGHQHRIFQASPVDERTGRHAIMDPELQGPSKSVASAWLSPAGQAGLLIGGGGRWVVQPELFDVLSSRDRAALADERAANRSAYGMGPDPLAD